jgi:hypothetical protein
MELISILFWKYNNMTAANQTALISAIKNLCISIFHPAKQSEISSATTIAALQNCIKFNNTDQEIAARGLNKKRL